MQDHASKRVCLHGGATLGLSSLLTWQSSTQQLKLFVAVHRGCMVIRLATKKASVHPTEVDVLWFSLMFTW